MRCVDDVCKVNVAKNKWGDGLGLRGGRCCEPSLTEARGPATVVTERANNDDGKVSLLRVRFSLTTARDDDRVAQWTFLPTAYKQARRPRPPRHFRLRHQQFPWTRTWPVSLPP